MSGWRIENEPETEEQRAIRVTVEAEVKRAIEHDSYLRSFAAIEWLPDVLARMAPEHRAKVDELRERYGFPPLP